MKGKLWNAKRTPQISQIYRRKSVQYLSAFKEKKKKAVALIPATGSNSKLDEAREKEKYSSFMTSNNNVP